MYGNTNVEETAVMATSPTNDRADGIDEIPQKNETIKRYGAGTTAIALFPHSPLKIPCEVQQRRINKLCLEF
jgi:hypothetical protein